MKVAILIPTMNRPEFVERTVAYYDSLKSPHPIYIGDASPSEIAARTVTCLKRFRNVEVKYFHWEGMGANKTVAKLAEIAQVACHYCATIGDDDYFVPSSLSQCAEFLSENADYRTAQGRAATVALDRPGPYGEILSLGDYWGINALEQENSAERLALFQKKYFVSQFSTHRTEEYIQDSRHILELVDPLVGELLHCFIFAIKGRSKFIDCLYLVRNVHEGIFHPEFFEWTIQEHWSSDYQKMLHALTLALQETSNFPLNEATRIVAEVMKLHLKQSYELAEKDKRRWSVPAKLRNAIPSYLKNVIRGFTRGASDMRLLRSKESPFYDKFLPVSISLTKVESPKEEAALE